MIEFTNLTSKPIRRKVFEKLYRKTMQKNHDVSVVFAPPALMKKLNKIYRGKNKPTNVLSFSLHGAPGGQGEIFLNVVERDLSYLFIHGCLHLQGYDHKTTKDAGRMESKEHEVLKKIGR